MARSLSSNALAGIGGSSNPVWLVQMESSGGTYYFGSETFVDGETTYYGNRLLRKTGPGKIKQAIRLEEGGAFEEVTEFTLQLANADLYSDTIASEFFENRRVEMRLAFADKAGASWANSVPCFFGYVNDTPQFDFEKITFRCTRGQRKWKKTVPSRLLTKEEFEHVPDANVGKAIPIIYGSFTEAVAHRDCIAGKNPRDAALGYLLRGNEADGNYVRKHLCFACHDLFDFLGLGPGDSLNASLVWNTDIKRWGMGHLGVGTRSFSNDVYQRIYCLARPAGNSVWQLIPEFVSQVGTTSGPLCVDENPSQATVLQVAQSATYRLPRAKLLDIATSAPVRLMATLWKNPLAFDDILRMTVTKADEFDSPLVVDIPYGQMVQEPALLEYLWRDTPSSSQVSGTATGGSSSTLVDSNACFASSLAGKYWVKMTNDAFPGDIQLRAITGVPNSTTVNISPNWDRNPTANDRYEIYRRAWNFESDGYSEVGIKFEYVRIGGAIADFHIANLYLENYSNDRAEDAIAFFNLKGRKFGSWIDHASHSNSFNAGDLIESPAYMLESLLIDELGLSIGEISAADFDALATNKSIWKFARQILEQKEILDFVRELCYEAGFGCFVRPDGSFCLRRIDATYGSVTTYDKSHMLYPGGKPSIKVERGSLKNVYNDFVLRYKVNMATGEPEKIMFVRKPDAGGDFDLSYSNIPDSGQAEAMWYACQAAYEKFQQVNLWEHTAEWIRDDWTAELFLEFMIHLLTRVPYKVTFTSALDLIGLELLDECKIAHALLPDAVSGISCFRLVEQEIDPQTDTIKNVFLEVA